MRTKLLCDSTPRPHQIRTTTLVQIRAPHRISEEHHTRRQCEMLHKLLACTRYGLIIVQSQFSRQPALLENAESVRHRVVNASQDRWHYVRASGVSKGCLSHTVNTKVTKPWEDPASRDFRLPTCACFGARLRMVELKAPTARADLHQPDERNTLWYSIIRFLPVTRYSTTPYSSRQGER